ncbi:porin [Lutimonas zeaxanthinifaciens]|uniref:porin n=1 Tax=Lutimonas zeaxanthinifaciens TaxID=3060215 RepID=UPI00265CBDAE|nr:porin [Lutimonas sp. YSD2104]WKK64647.1 porin [Lutimonas sp. YSD2104]
MKFKSKVLILLLIISIPSVFAQNRQVDTVSTYRSLIPTGKQSLLKNVDMIANLQMALRSDFYEGEHLETKFRVEQFRLEFKGYVHEKIYFRFRHRYTSTFEPQSIDKIIKGVDFAFVRFDVSEKVQLTIGKTFADWGGIEFDLNPIYVYEFSDIIEKADNFLTGVGAYWQATERNGFSFQILNSRTQSFEELYQGHPELEGSDIPLAAVVNWRGKFLDGKFTTLWSYSLFNEAKDTFKNYIALGNQLKLDKWTIAYDFKWSKEDLDRTGIISEDVPDDLYPWALENTLYYSHWTKIDYRFAKKWGASFTGFIDQAKWLDDIDPEKTTDHWRTGYGIIPSLEFYPWSDINLKFFAVYVGRIYNYSSYAESRVGLVDYQTGRFAIGIISPLKIF